MAKIGIEGLGAGHREEHRAERHKSDHAVAEKKAHAVNRIERPEHARIFGDIEACGGDREKPNQSDGTEESRHARRTPRLHREKGEKD